MICFTPISHAASFIILHFFLSLSAYAFIDYAAYFFRDFFALMPPVSSLPTMNMLYHSRYYFAIDMPPRADFYMPLLLLMILPAADYILFLSAAFD